MQTPKTRKSSIEVPQKVSPRTRSLEVTPKNSPRAGSSEGPARVVRQLRTGLDTESTGSSNRVIRTQTDKSPKVSERRSPRTLSSETKRPSKVAELESQISQLESDLKKVKDQLISSEARKEQAKQDAEQLKKQLLDLSIKLEESQKQISIESSDQIILSELENSIESAALASAINEINELKAQLEIQTNNAQLAQTEVITVKGNLAETLVLMEEVKVELADCKESEVHARALVTETLEQLEIAKRTVEILQSDGFKSIEAYNSLASELEISRARVKVLEELVSKGHEEEEELGDRDIKSEAEQLRSALEEAEIRYNEEITHGAIEIRDAKELVEQINLRTSQLESELEMKNNELEELKANLMDKETELQGICEENESLNTKMRSVLSNTLEKDLESSKTETENLKVKLTENETKLRNVLAENEMLKKKEEEKEAVMEEEAEKSHRKVSRVAEQLEAAQVMNSDLEGELRRLKVQADQWRKAAEAAASMLSSVPNNNGKVMERTGSMDTRYSPKYDEDVEDDVMKKKNANMLKKFGVLWKKQQK